MRNLFIIVQLSSTRLLAIVYIKQPYFIVQLSSTRRLHCLYEATFVVFHRSIILNAPFDPLFMVKQPLLFLSLQLSSTRRLAIDYIKQPLLFFSFNYPQRAVYIVYLKQPLLYLSFNYPQRAGWPLFILRNLCCFYRSIMPRRAG